MFKTYTECDICKKNDHEHPTMVFTEIVAKTASKITFVDHVCADCFGKEKIFKFLVDKFKLAQ